MKTIKNIIGVLVVVVLCVLFVGHFQTPSNISLGSDAPNKLSGSATISAGISVTNTSASVLVASGGRQFAMFTNDSSTVPIYLSFTGTTAAVANKGVAVEPLQTVVINLSNQYVGQVNAITASSTAVLVITAFQ